MSEPIWVHVWIRTPADWQPEPERAPWFVEALTTGEHGYGILINGESLEGVEVNGGITWFANGEGNYGLADPDLVALLDFLTEQRIPYIAADETKYDMPGGKAIFDGTTIENFPADNDGGAVLDLATWNEIWRTTDPEDIPGVVQRFFERGNISADELSVEHLQGTPCPQRQEA